MSETRSKKRSTDVAETAIIDDRPGRAIDRDAPPAKLPLSEILAVYTAVIYVLCGRGKVGKTFISNMLVKRLYRLGHQPLIIDADDKNDGLRGFYGDVEDPDRGPRRETPYGRAHRRKDEEETHDFIKRMIDIITLRRGFAVWDVGGNDQSLDDYARDTPLERYLQSRRIAMVTIYVHGHDPSDLSNIVMIDRNKAYQAQRVVICANAGAPRPNRPAHLRSRREDPFAKVAASPFIADLVQRGAGLITIPEFAHADALNELDIDLLSIVDGKLGSDGGALGPQTHDEICWWWADVEAAFAAAEEGL